jgi:hypothetical protein
VTACRGAYRCGLAGAPQVLHLHGSLVVSWQPDDLFSLISHKAESSHKERAIAAAHTKAVLSGSLQPLKMVLNVIPLAQTGYITCEEPLENFLRRKYGNEYPDWEFNVQVHSPWHFIPGNCALIVQHVMDRWQFEAPEIVSIVGLPILKARRRANSSRRRLSQ